jgi:hypothetical protein
MPASSDERALSLLINEYLNAEDSRFVDTLRQIRSPKFLAGLADRWKKDPRPWARQQIFDYLARPLDRPGHQPVVKQLFKQAEANQDDELMAVFLMVFDRLVRRELDTRSRWDSETSSVVHEEILTTPRNCLIQPSTRNIRNPATGDEMTYTPKQPRGGRLFGYHTRYYLRRRAWRYFRKMAYRRPDAYTQAVSRALAQYRDEDLSEGENVLDSWGLVHICFGEHEALEFQATHIVLKEGRSLGDLSPAPYFSEAWQTPKGAELLFSLLWQANARLVRVWTIQLLRRVRQTVAIDLAPEQLLRFFDHDDVEVQQFGAELLESSPGLEKMPVSFWLKLLKTKNLTVLETVAQKFLELVSAERLDLQQCLELASAKTAPVARLGLSFLKSRSFASPQERSALRQLGQARCAAIGKELGNWALTILGRAGIYDVEQVQPFFDSLLFEIRQAAWDWLVTPESPGYNDPVLWSRLTESPFDDIRLRLIDHLHARSKLPSVNGDLANVWTTVLLGVHRGGRQKAKAVRQAGAAIQQDPSRTESLLPVLAVAVRSVRRPEARAGLAAVVQAVEAHPEIAPLVKKFLPELELSPAEAAA